MEKKQKFEEDLKAMLKSREDITTPYTYDVPIGYAGGGTDLSAIEPFTKELTEIVDAMKEQLANEIRILEGTDIPNYGSPEWPLENELSGGETKGSQWNNDLPSGFSTTGHLPTSTHESSSSVSSANPSNPNCPILPSSEKSLPVSTRSSGETLEGCGCETGVTSGSCDCTEQTTNVPMAGTPNEEK
jgi:hypothetical protein